MTDHDLAFIDLPDAADLIETGTAEGPVVDLSAVQKGQLAHWRARIVRTEGVVDEKNRVTYVVARVEDPYKLTTSDDSVSALPMGTFVAASIEGMTIDGVVRVPRTALRGNDQLMFVDAENRIRMIDVDVLRADSEFAYLQGSSLPGDRISLTVIESPINGMKVRTTDDPPADPATNDAEARVAGGASN